MPRVRAPATHRKGGWVGPRARLDAVARWKNPIIALAGNWTPVVQLVDEFPKLAELPRFSLHFNTFHNNDLTPATTPKRSLATERSLLSWRRFHKKNTVLQICKHFFLYSLRVHLKRNRIQTDFFNSKCLFGETSFFFISCRFSNVVARQCNSTVRGSNVTYKFSTWNFIRLRAGRSKF
jgi:hypothetical protein